MKLKCFLDFTCGPPVLALLQDIIPGVMTWKRFQSLVFLSLPETSKTEVLPR